ncbi:hypothetical protein HY635_04380 [Candidatus Uhrbacteria bacterium]|nr:hypothetical protein [Candidatus Uhrbacteria bacterium]
MHLGEKLAALEQRFGKHVEVFETVRICWIIPFTRSRGWLSIKGEEAHWAVLWTSDRDTHSPLLGSAIGVDIRKDDGTRYRPAGLTGAWRSAISLWPARDEGEADQIERRMRHLIELAYRWHVVRPLMNKPDLIQSVQG